LLVTKKEVREGKKDKYLRLEFIDKSGSVAGNCWTVTNEVIDGYQEGDIVKIQAQVQNYKEQVQLKVNKIRKANSDEYNLIDFIAQTKKDIDKMIEELFIFIESVKDDKIKELLLKIFQDKELINKFSQCPAGKSWHHNYVGGLLEHTLNVAKICDFASNLYSVNRDLLITGAILHDIGKIFEYTIIPFIDFTDEGRLIGHIVEGDRLIVNKTTEINLFPKETLMLLRHILLSHHGELEKGAVKVPMTIEAVILHFADNLDAQTTGVQQLKNATIDTNARWTEFDKLNNRYIYIGNKDE
jgi:3'-5' exoribonuclease